MAEVFALQRIQGDILFRNDDYVAAEKVRAINRLLEYLRFQMRTQVCPAGPSPQQGCTCGRLPHTCMQPSAVTGCTGRS